MSHKLFTAHKWLNTYIREEACTIQKFETFDVSACTHSVHKSYTKILNAFKTFIVEQ